MTETQNVATYSRVRPYNPAINEDKRLTARCVGVDKIVNQNGDREDTYNFTRVYGPPDSTDDVFETAMKPLLDFKILEGITSIFIVYGQSGSGKSFTLIGEDGHLGLLPKALQYLLQQDKVQKIEMSTIECYGIKAAKIGFYDLVEQLSKRRKDPKKFDPYLSKDNSRVNAQNAQTLRITKDNCLQIITDLQDVSHMAPTLKNPHSSRGHTVYFAKVTMKGLEPVYFICVDLAGSEGQTALGTKDEFVEGLRLAMSKGKLHMGKKEMAALEQMYKTRSLEAGCINNGLTQLQTIFGELIKKRISKAQGLGLRKVLSSFITLNSAYAVLFTLSASANNNKVTRATLNFAKQTQLVKVETKKAKVRIDKDAVIKELNLLIEQLRVEMAEKDKMIRSLEQLGVAGVAGVSADSVQSADRPDTASSPQNKQSPISITATQLGSVSESEELEAVDPDDVPKIENALSDSTRLVPPIGHMMSVEEQQSRENDLVQRINTLREEYSFAVREEEKWTAKLQHPALGPGLSEEELRAAFDRFDIDQNGTIDENELQHVLDDVGKHMDIDTIDELIAAVDTNHDGVVDFEEFKVMVGQSWFINTFQSSMAEKVKSDHLRVMSQIEALPEVDEFVSREELEEELRMEREDELLQSLDQLQKENQDLKEEVTTFRGGRAPDAVTPTASQTQYSQHWGCLQLILNKFAYVDYRDRPHLYHHFG